MGFWLTSSEYQNIALSATSKFSNSQNTESIDKVVIESLNSSNTNDCFWTNMKSQDSYK